MIWGDLQVISVEFDLFWRGFASDFCGFRLVFVGF
jgi:hypothetical protein